MQEYGEIYGIITGAPMRKHDVHSSISKKVILVSPSDLPERYYDLYRPIAKRLDSAKFRSLLLLLDVLLPTFISGKLLVPDAERIVSRCA